MSGSRYRGYSLRSRIFWGFFFVCLLSILSSALVSFFILRNNAIEQSRTDQQKKSDALMASLDYAVSHTQVETDDLKGILGNKIYEISDISKADVVLYDLDGRYLLSNKDSVQVEQVRLPMALVKEVLGSDKRVDVTTYDEALEANVMSSYMVLKNNMLEPIGIVYFPYYHSDSVYMAVFKKYGIYLVVINIFIVLVGVRYSWLISKNLTKALTKFSNLISKIALFDHELNLIKYYENDELKPLINSYNRMIVQIQEQKARLEIIQREQAWREMAKQVAHEVKNPLTPMKLTIQNFRRKFNPEDPNIVEKFNQMSDSVVEQIDLIARVASAFSQFAQLPEKHNEVFDLNKEVSNIIRVFDDGGIFVHFNREGIRINMDKIYLNRILTNLVTNAQQAADENRQLMINVDVEQIQKRITISVEDNGVGIPEEMLERIFEPNFTSKNSGMGLGLTMVKKMVEDCGGEISVKSEVGKGTRFTIALPSNL
ncbi:ATP-binding protein [Bergeyella sp. RCAD1439]|uniref:ATP-binding protein n=1 Tax=Bergeyella anatis TaxID=3113737 RepID=UPI002E184A5E|nr:ATP-binding protein [Bergeyella sp. RCAD1439]